MHPRNFADFSNLHAVALMEFGGGISGFVCRLRAIRRKLERVVLETIG